MRTRCHGRNNHDNATTMSPVVCCMHDLLRMPCLNVLAPGHHINYSFPLCLPYPRHARMNFLEVTQLGQMNTCKSYGVPLCPTEKLMCV